MDPEIGDRAELPTGEFGTVVQILGKTMHADGSEVTMLRVATAYGYRIWSSADLASLVRERARQEPG